MNESRLLKDHPEWMRRAAQRIKEDIQVRFGLEDNESEYNRLASLYIIKEEFDRDFITVPSDHLLKEQEDTIGLLSQQLADKKEIIRRLTT